MGAKRWIAILQVTIGLTLLTSSGARAGSVAVSRLSTLHITGETSLDLFDNDDAFPDFGLYDKTIADSVAGAGGGSTTAQAAQRSLFGPDSVSGFASGSASTQLTSLDPIQAQASSRFEFVFDIIGQAEAMRVSGSIFASIEAAASVSLLTEAGDALLSESAQDQPSEVSFERTFQLPVGRYRLTGDVISNGTFDLVPARFDVNFTLGEPAAVPLPAAVWPASAVLFFGLLKGINRKVRNAHSRG